MKYKITKLQAYKICTYFQGKMEERYLYKPLTPALLEIMNADLKYQQMNMVKEQGNILWGAPLEIINHNHRIIVDFDWTQVEIIDL